MAAKHETGLVICVTGPESTGKTTLATQLAEALSAPLVREMAREILARCASEPASENAPSYTSADVLAIAEAQLEAEREALRSGAPVVVADTDLTVIQVWWEEKYGALHPWIIARLAERSRRRYLLMLPDLAWEPDPLRESPFDRERLLERYREILAESAFPVAEISGSGADRLEGALQSLRLPPIRP